MDTTVSKIMSLPEQAKKWMMIALAIIVISILACVAFTRFSFSLVFSWVAFLFVVPYVWEIYGKEAIVLDFWSAVFKFGIRLPLSFFIFLLLRGYVAYFVKFGMMTSQTIGVGSGKAGWFEMNQPEVLFEASFMLLVGYTVLVFVYKRNNDEEKKKNRWSRNVVVGWLVACFLGQLFAFSVGAETTEAAMSPLRGESFMPAVKGGGVLGGGVNRVSAFLFGESISVPSSQIVCEKKIGMPKIILSNTYTDADLGSDSTVEIIDFTKTKVLKGDVIVIHPTMPKSADQVKVSESDGQWTPMSNNGEFTMTYNNSPTLGNTGILFTKGQGVKVKVELVRNIPTV